MSLIEQASKRLEQLREAGVEMPFLPGAGLLNPVATPVRTPMGQAPGNSPFKAPGAVPVATVAQAAPQAPTTQLRVDDTQLADLDLARLAQANFLVTGFEKPENDVWQSLSRDFKCIKRPLIDNINGKTAGAIARANLVLLTSALPSEGKTYCAINLAMSMAAEVDRTVLLIDADVVRPSIGETLGLKGKRGLLDLLADPSVDPAELIFRTNIDKFAVMPAGMPRANSAELLASNAMNDLLERLAAQSKDLMVIIDAPPLLPTAEARILARLVGQVVMIVEAGKTTRNVVGEAFAAIESCPVVLSVLNKRSAVLRKTQYGYGYGY